MCTACVAGALVNGRAPQLLQFHAGAGGPSLASSHLALNLVDQFEGTRAAVLVDPTQCLFDSPASVRSPGHRRDEVQERGVRGKPLTPDPEGSEELQRVGLAKPPLRNGREQFDGSANFFAELEQARVQPLRTPELDRPVHPPRPHGLQLAPVLPCLSFDLIASMPQCGHGNSLTVGSRSLTHTERQRR